MIMNKDKSISLEQRTSGKYNLLMSVVENNRLNQLVYEHNLHPS